VWYHPRRFRASEPVASLLLDARAISKSFAGLRALERVSFELRPGEVHALVGENGAGKSTFIKILTGAERADSGTLNVDGVPVHHITPHASRELGIAAIYQQPALFPHLTIAENIALALDRGGAWRRIDHRARRQHAAALLDRIGASLNPDRLVGGLTMPEQQVVEIAKALGADARIVIMDEPTASLSAREVSRLFDVITRLREGGTGIIYISHRLEEIAAIADRVTVLRDGQTVATRDARGVSRPELIRMMVGRELDAVFPKRQVPLGEVALTIRQLSNRRTGVHHVSFSLRRGEILGLAGLVGSGRTQLAETIFGLTPADDGEILVGGAPARIESPADAIRFGIGYVPEDRRQHGVVLDMSVAANVSAACLGSVSKLGLIDRAAEDHAATSYVDRFHIKTSSVHADVGSLSGGNQQKVALARWLSTEPAVLILDEPTQGVDVGSKAEIHRLMQDLAGRGLAILMISSELPEILGMSDRILVMHAGTIAAEFTREAATPAIIMAAALGESANADEEAAHSNPPSPDVNGISGGRAGRGT
jgi:rhamnose transport system ATP-binding protein